MQNLVRGRNSEMTTTLVFHYSNFQHFSSHGTHKLITKILWHTKKHFFADLTKKRYNFDSFILDGNCCACCCHFFKFDNLREKRSVSLT